MSADTSNFNQVKKHTIRGEAYFVYENAAELKPKRGKTYAQTNEVASESSYYEVFEVYSIKNGKIRHHDAPEKVVYMDIVGYVENGVFTACSDNNLYQVYLSNFVWTYCEYAL